VIEIKKTNKINVDMAQSIRRLESIVSKHDHLRSSMSLEFGMNQLSDMPNTFLLYDENDLISVMTIFMPTLKTAEIYAMTHPSYRKLGYFKKLYNEVLKTLKPYVPLDILFICESQSRDGLACLNKLGASFSFTEYSMHYIATPSNIPKLEPTDLWVGRALPLDLEDLVVLSQRIFNNTEDDARRLIHKSMSSEHKIQYLASLNGIIVGMGAVSLESPSCYIVGIGIDPEYRGRGYGKTLIKKIMIEQIMQGNTDLLIEVDSNNDIAYQIYLKTGFTIKVALGYYKKTYDHYND
jgi:ribosomal protein S18 acetylase RimI-like enzyme